MNIKERFENYSLKEIILLYLSVVLFAILIFILYGNFIKSSQLFNPIRESKMKSIEDKTKRLSDIELFQYFNRNIENLNISLREMNISQKVTTIKVEGNYKKVMNFLMIVSHNFKIKQFLIESILDKVLISMEINTNIYFISKKKVLLVNNLKSPFLRENKKDNKKTSLIVITAIVDFEVLINNQWYKKGDIFNKYKILEIRKNGVILKDLENKKEIFKGVNNE